MEATQSGTLNGLFSIFSNPLFAYPIGMVGGVLLTLVTKFGEGWINAYYADKERKKARKFKAAEDINSFVVDGMHKGFRIKAGSEHHIRFRATEIEAIDVEVGTKLREFIGAWGMYRVFLKEHPTFEETREAIEYHRKAQKLGEELLEVAREWGK